MIGRPDPDALMAGELGQWLAAQNDVRAQAKAKSRKYQTYGIIGAVIAAVVAIMLGGDVETAFYVGLAAGGLGFGAAELVRRPVINSIKGAMNGAIAKALDLEFSASVTPGESFNRAKTYGLLPSYDDDYFEDLWWGVLGERPFTLHEAKLTETRGSGKNRRTVTVFHGSIMQIGFARPFSGITLIGKQGEHRKFFGGEHEQITLADRELTRCDMVDPQFEDRFTVWSSDPVEGRYLVHPEYIERLIAVEQAFDGKNIRALFLEGDLTIALETGNMFESGSLEQDRDRALLARAIDQFASLAELATRLNERERAGFN